MLYFLGVVKHDPVWMNVSVLITTFTQFLAQLGFSNPVGFLNVQDDFVQIMRVIVGFAQFNLPRANIWSIVKDVFERVEIHQRAFDFVQSYFPDSELREILPKSRGIVRWQ